MTNGALMTRKTKQEIVEAALILFITLVLAFTTGCGRSTTYSVSTESQVVADLTEELVRLQTELNQLKVDNQTEQDELEARIASLAAEVASLQALVEELQSNKHRK